MDTLSSAPGGLRINTNPPQSALEMAELPTRCSQWFTVRKCEEKYSENMWVQSSPASRVFVVVIYSSLTTGLSICPPSREDLDIKIFTANMSLGQLRAQPALLVITTTWENTTTLFIVQILGWMWPFKTPWQV